MRVAETSLEAYRTIQLNDRQQDVYNCLLTGNKSDQEIAEELGWTVNRVTGRRNELVDMGRVRMIGTKQSRFNRRVYVWGACNQQLRLL